MFFSFRNVEQSLLSSRMSITKCQSVAPACTGRCLENLAPVGRSRACSISPAPALDRHRIVGRSMGGYRKLGDNLRADRLGPLLCKHYRFEEGAGMPESAPRRADFLFPARSTAGGLCYLSVGIREAPSRSFACEGAN